MSFSRWLDWTPRGGKLGNSPEPDSQNFFDAKDGPEVFPHCPKCASYALYRKNNAGNYECQTCGLTDIPEAIARRVQ